MIEEWKDIPDFEGKYQISTEGRVKSLSRLKIHPRGNSITTEKILKTSVLSGRSGIHLYNAEKNISSRFQLSRLVAKTFIPNPNNYPVVNHKDGNPLNDKVDNLEWCTQRENVSHGKSIKRPTPGIYKTKYNTYSVICSLNGKRIFLGTFKEESEAISIKNKWNESNNIVNKYGKS